MPKTCFDDGLVQGWWDVEGQGVLHVHFYGSNQLEDWVADFSAMKRRDQHAGFTRYADRALTMVWPLVTRFKDVRLTGHSLGGAIAVLVGCALLRFQKSVVVETAGAPRVGGLLWWLLDGRDLAHTRYEVVGDLVPKLPPWWLGWKHSGKRVAIQRPEIKSLVDKHQPGAYNGHVPFDLC